MRLRPGEPRTPLGGAYSVPRPLAVFEGPLCGREGEGKGREGREKEGRGRGRRGGEGRGGKGEGREGEEWEGREMDPRNFENRSTLMLQTLTATSNCLARQLLRLTSSNLLANSVRRNSEDGVSMCDGHGLADYISGLKKNCYYVCSNIGNLSMTLIQENFQRENSIDVNRSL